jgi:AcrR family transcriptional regulator
MSTREVLARTGAPRGSVYHYFPRGRTELIEHAIDHSQRWMHAQIDAIQPPTPVDVVAGYLDIWRRALERTDFHAGRAVVGVPVLRARRMVGIGDAPMLGMLNGRERSQTEYRNLLEQAGFKFEA